MFVKFKWDAAVSLYARSLVQPSSWKYSLLPRWVGRLVCMGGKPCCGRWIVLCRVKEEQHTHAINYGGNRSRKRKPSLTLVGIAPVDHQKKQVISNVWIEDMWVPVSTTPTGGQECDMHSLHLIFSHPESWICLIWSAAGKSSVQNVVLRYNTCCFVL